MSWQGAQQFFAMGGYALYVWGSVGLVAFCMTVEPLLVRARWRKALRLVLTISRATRESAT